MRIVDLMIQFGTSTPRQHVEEYYREMTMYIYPERMAWGEMSVSLDPPVEVIGLEAILSHPKPSLVLYFLDSCMPSWLLCNFMAGYYPSFVGTFRELLAREPHVHVIVQLKEYLI